ncbi:hypothetical protein [Mycobacterium sp. MMS18-G62]
MNVNLRTLFARADQPGTDNNASTVGKPSDTGAAGGGLTGSLRILFACWVGLDAAVVIGLAVWNTTLTRSAWDLIGSALLLGIGITCALAFGQILTGSGNAVLTSMVSQIFIVGLAAYVWLVDQRSPVSQLLGITGIALTLGCIALLWVLYLARFARGAVTRGATVVVALFPLIGLVQFWLETEYLPQASRPLVDFSAELSPMGATGPVIHLLAKVTMHNRGSVQADLPTALMRVTSYPFGTPSQPATPDTVLEGIRSSGSYRETPTPTADARLLYAEILAAPDSGAFLGPGDTAVYKRVIDVDSRTVRLVRLTADGSVVTQRMLEDTHTCNSPQISFSKDPRGYKKAAGQLHDWIRLGPAMCAESQFASRGVIQDLVSDHPVLRTVVVVDNPQHAIELPTLFAYFGTRETIDDPLGLVDIGHKIETANPASSLEDSAEYAPSDADLHRAPG